MKKYIVATGIVKFEVVAVSFREAINELKRKFADARLDRHFHAQRWGFGMSLVEAHHEGRLNFLVFDEGMNDIIGGELNGEFEDIASLELVEQFSHYISESLRLKQKQKIRQATQ